MLLKIIFVAKKKKLKASAAYKSLWIPHFNSFILNLTIKLWPEGCKHGLCLHDFETNVSQMEGFLTWWFLNSILFFLGLATS